MNSYCNEITFRYVMNQSVLLIFRVRFKRDFVRKKNLPPPLSKKKNKTKKRVRLNIRGITISPRTVSPRNNKKTTYPNRIISFRFAIIQFISLPGRYVCSMVTRLFHALISMDRRIDHSSNSVRSLLNPTEKGANIAR